MQQQIVLTNAPAQAFTSTLQVDGAPLTLNFVFRYNEVANYWVMRVSDQNDVLLLDSVPLVTGNSPACNILGQFAYLEIGSAYVLNVTGVRDSNFPNSFNLGTGFILVWGDTPTAPPLTQASTSEAILVAVPGTAMPWNAGDATYSYLVTAPGTAGVLVPCFVGQQIQILYISGLVSTNGGPTFDGNGAGAGTANTGGANTWPSDRLPGGRTLGSIGEFCGAYLDISGKVLLPLRIDDGVTLPPAPANSINLSLGINDSGDFSTNTGNFLYAYTYL